MQLFERAHSCVGESLSASLSLRHLAQAWPGHTTEALLKLSGVAGNICLLVVGLKS